MTNEMKLLRAFIEASGYEIKDVTEIVDILDMSRPEKDAMLSIKQVVDYKVTKKKIQMGGRGSSKTPLILRKHND